MRNLLSKKKGFTLIELLIVLAIVMLLSFMAINGYMDYRKSALLKLSGDNIISQINEQKTRTIYGETKDTAKCYGILFESNEVWSFSHDFDTDKIFEDKEWIYKGCYRLEIANENKQKIDLDEKIIISKLELYNDEQRVQDIGDHASIRFYPPNGYVEVFEVGTLINENVDALHITMEDGDYGETFIYKF